MYSTENEEKSPVCERWNQGGEGNFPYILLNEIQTMFSQLAKQSVRFWSADMPPTRAQMLHVPTELGR